jgi:hypothetical protein
MEACQFGIFETHFKLAQLWTAVKSPHEVSEKKEKATQG